MKFRYARHTDNLEALIAFYTEIIGLKKLGEFKDHAQYNGVFLGFEGADWHIEFTTSHEPAKHSCDEDDLLVFYVEAEAFEQIKKRIQERKLAIKTSKNPYWNTRGIELLDPDGFGVILTIQQK